MHCMNCGKELPAHARFCFACGAPVSHVVDAEQTQIAPARVESPAAYQERSNFADSTNSRSIAATSAAPSADQRGLTNAAQNAFDRPPHAGSSTEHVIFTVRPTLLFVLIGYVVAAVVALLLVVLLAYAGVPYLVSLLIALVVMFVPAATHLKRNSVLYRLTDAKLDIEQGLLMRTTKSILLRNVQDVTVSRSLWQRMFGFGNIVIDNAGAEGGSTTLVNIPDARAYADQLLNQLRAR